MRDRKRPKDADLPTAEAAVDLNQVVAYNFRRARELRGWTQEEAALHLERFIGQRLPQASISAIERAWDGEKRREFDAQELLLFARTFNVPIMWFFLPPPGDHRPLANTSDYVEELVHLTIGYAEHLEEMQERLREIGLREPGEDDAAWERITGQPTRTSEASYQRRRKDLILAMLDDRADKLDKAAEELGKFFDHLRQVGIRGFLAENTNDSDYARPPEARRSRPAP